MTILDVTLDAPLLDAETEVELAKRIEAGLYAEHLIAIGSGRCPLALTEVRRRGREAWQRLWLSNLKLVMRFAVEYARRHVLPVDELFQEGCLALAKAMQRFDHSRGTRFSTLAHDYVWRHVAATAAGRCGELEGSSHRARVRQHLRRVERESDAPASLRQLAALAGVSVESAVQSRTTRVPIDNLAFALAAECAGYEAIESHGTDFLNLLPERYARFLRLRFGLDGPERTLTQVARLLRMSATSAGRLEEESLAAARRLLSQEQCQLAG